VTDKLLPGQFIWTNFPFAERPLEPGPQRHLGYVVMVSPDQAIVAYTTTSKILLEGPRRKGVTIVSDQNAEKLGQKRFAIDARRLAFLPINEQFFPEINSPTRGVRGNAGQTLRAHIERSIADLLHEPQLMEILGPKRPPALAQQHRDGRDDR